MLCQAEYCGCCRPKILWSPGVLCTQKTGRLFLFGCLLPGAPRPGGEIPLRIAGLVGQESKHVLFQCE